MFNAYKHYFNQKDREQGMTIPVRGRGIVAISEQNSLNVTGGSIAPANPHHGSQTILQLKPENRGSSAGGV